MLNGILNFYEQEAITIEGYLKNKVIRIKVTGKMRGVYAVSLKAAGGIGTLNTLR